MATKRRPDQSQLDYLWDMFGDLSTVNDPLLADDNDILNKKGVSNLVVSMIRSLLKNLELKESDSLEHGYDVIGTANNGDKRVLFSFDKEDHLAAVTLRRALEPDVEDGVANDVGDPILDFEMKLGSHPRVSLKSVFLEGSKTSSINTIVENGKIFSKLRLANSDDPTMNVEVIQSGLLIETIVAKHDGQVKLEKSAEGFKVSYKWADGKDIQLKEMDWAEYTVEENMDGTVYFLKDKGYIVLNGHRYGEIPDDVVRYTDYHTEQNPKRKAIVLKKGDAILSEDCGDKVSLIKQNKNNVVIVGDSNHEIQVFGSDKFKYNGQVVIYENDLDETAHKLARFINKVNNELKEDIAEAREEAKSLVKAEEERTNAMIQTLNSNVAHSIGQLNDNVVAGFNTINAGIDGEIRPAIEENRLGIKALNQTVATVNQNLVDSINAINKNVSDGFNTINGGIDNEIRPAIKKNEDDIVALNETVATVNQNMADGFNTINQNVADGFNTINGGLDNEIRPAIAENKESIKALNETVATVNQNVADSINAINQNVVDGFNTINGGLDNEIRPAIEKNKEDIVILNGTVATVNRNLADSINAINQNMADGFNTINGGIENEVKPRITKNEEDIAKLNETVITVNENLVNSINAINQNVSDGFNTINGGIENEVKPAIEENKEGIKALNEALGTVNQNVADSIAAINKNVSDGFNTINGGLDNEIRPAIEENKEGIKALNETVATVNQNVADSIASINQNMIDGFNTINGGLDNEVRPAIEENKAAIRTLNETVAAVNQNMADGFTAINKNVADGFNTINGGLENEVKPRITKNEEDIQALNTVVEEVKTSHAADVEAINKTITESVEPRITKNEEDIVKLNEAVDGVKADLTSSIEAVNQSITDNINTVNEAIEGDVKARITKNEGDITSLNESVTEAKESIAKNASDIEAINKALDDEIRPELAKSVKNVDVSTDENPNRKAIVMNNHDLLLGAKTDGTTVNLAMLSKWDVADFGSTQVHINLNGSEERPTYNDDKGIALLTDIETLTATIADLTAQVEALKQEVEALKNQQP